ncbi:MAG TPA: TPM domain-containing protein [Bacteroidales bacterium]|nr:TPM domain-containing protein [Bacteroidales bacterium]
MDIKASTFFTKEQQEQIRAAIKEAEEATSGEIRVHIETSLTGDVLDRAAWIFKKIRMHETEKRNGVLFYIVVRNKQFAIIGDRGINAMVPEDFWDKAKNLLQKHFRNEKYTEGLAEAVLLAGQQLKEHFPRMKDDINELPDEISFDDPEKS